MKMFKTLLIACTFVIFSCKDDSIFENQESIETSNLVSSGCPLGSFSQCINVASFLDSNIITNSDLQDMINTVDTAYGVTFYFPSGTYLVEGNNRGLNFFTQENSQAERIGFPNGLELVGDVNDNAITSIIKYNVSECNRRMVWIDDSNDVTIHNLIFDGNRDSFDCGVTGGANNFEEGNNIRIRFSHNITIENIESVNAGGDALNIGCSTNIVVRDSFFDQCNRNGLTLGAAGNASCETLDDLRVVRNTFGSKIDTQQIDFEEAEAYTNIVIRDNTFETFNPQGDFDHQTAITLSRIRNDFEGAANSGSTHATILDNDFNQNAVLIRSSTFLDFISNDNVGQMQIDRNSSDLFIARNNFDIIPTGLQRLNDTFMNQNGEIVPLTGNDNFAGILIGQIDHIEPGTGSTDNDPNPAVENIVFQGNDIIVHDGFRTGVEVEDASNITLRNTLLEHISTTTNLMTGILLEARVVDTEANITNSRSIAGFDVDIDRINNCSGDCEVICNGNDCPN